VVTYLEAIRRALAEEMRRDDEVFLIGEDIGVYGGAFKVTEGLLDEFGPERVIDTPISEAGFTGAAIGAAMKGMRPVVEYQFADFISCAFDQITNFAAKLHYRLGIPVPVTFRAPSGGGVHGGPFHSQNPEPYFVSTPGLKVVAPSTPADARGLLKAAIRDDNPVLFLEHKWLYRRARGALSRDDGVVPLGEAAIRTPGDRLSILAYGAMAPLCLEAAERLEAKEGEGSVEVIDLRSLVPLDEERVLASVRKTGKVLLVHEGPRTGGFGGELAARIGDEAFVYLDGPIRRVTAADTPVPYSPPLEARVLPAVEDVVEAGRELLAW